MKKAMAMAWVLAAVVGVGMSVAAHAEDKPKADESDDATPLKFVVVEPGKPPPDWPQFATQVEQYRKAASVPADHNIRIGIKHYYQMEVGFHDMVALMTPVDAKGQPDGLESAYQEYVGLIHTTEYKAGLKDGFDREIVGGYAGSYVRLEIPWKAGKVDGMRRMYFKDGKVMNESPYVAGVEDGESHSFDESGKLTRKYTTKAGKRIGDMIDFWANSDKPKRVVPYKDGKIHGIVHEYYLEGPLKTEIPFQNDICQGIAKEYAPDGKVIKQTWWWNGDKVTQEEYEKNAKK